MFEGPRSNAQSATATSSSHGRVGLEHRRERILCSHITPGRVGQSGLRPHSIFAKREAHPEAAVEPPILGCRSTPLNRFDPLLLVLDFLVLGHIFRVIEVVKVGCIQLRLKLRNVRRGALAQVVERQRLEKGVPAYLRQRLIP